MILVTGGAGFIGSNLVRSLNQRGLDDIIVVDDLQQGDKFKNITDCRIADFIDKRTFTHQIANSSFHAKLQAVFHQGACSDTMEQDGRYMMENNYSYSMRLLDYCLVRQIPFIYASSASVYGAGPVFKEEPQYEKALNIYAYSKLLFDQIVRRRLPSNKSQIVGLRYFNVYGPREKHKGRMASVMHHFQQQYREQGHVRLFVGSDGYADGEQRRDFIWVGDVIGVNLYFLDHPDVSGIFNVGTGRSCSFNDVAAATINACDGTQKTVQDLAGSDLIRYIPFPEALIGKYQSFTEANTEALRNVGFDSTPISVEDGVTRYVQQQQT